MDNAYRFKRAVQIVSHDLDAIQRLCQVKVNEVGEVRRLRAIGDVSMSAQGYINACHDFLGLPEDRVRQLVWSLNEYRMTRREQLVGAYFGDDPDDVTHEVASDRLVEWYGCHRARALADAGGIQTPTRCTPRLSGLPETVVRADGVPLISRGSA